MGRFEGTWTPDSPRSRFMSCQADNFRGQEKEVVQPGGLEPPTYRFVVCCSIQLSYGCMGWSHAGGRL